MTVLEEVLIEEYDRSTRILRAIKAENESLPRGNISVKTINGHEYSYLQYREGKHVRSKYIKKENLKSVSQGLKRRKENEHSIKELNASRKQIIRALGKEFIDEHSRA